MKIKILISLSLLLVTLTVSASVDSSTIKILIEHPSVIGFLFFIFLLIFIIVNFETVKDFMFLEKYEDSETDTYARSSYLYQKDVTGNNYGRSKKTLEIKFFSRKEVWDVVYIGSFSAFYFFISSTITFSLLSFFWILILAPVSFFFRNFITRKTLRWYEKNFEPEILNHRDSFFA